MKPISVWNPAHKPRNWLDSNIMVYSLNQHNEMGGTMLEVHSESHKKICNWLVCNLFTDIEIDSSSMSPPNFTYEKIFTPMGWLVKQHLNMLNQPVFFNGFKSFYQTTADREASQCPFEKLCFSGLIGQVCVKIKPKLGSAKAVHFKGFKSFY